MRQIKDLKEKLLLTALYCLLLAVFWLFELPCVYKLLFGITCPGCGMSHALFSLLSLDFKAAFFYHPMIFTIPLLYIYFIFDGNLFKNKIINYGILIFIGIGFLVNWILKLF